jgi:hypothetical protein
MEFDKEPTMKQFTRDERIRRVWDMEEAKSVLARNTYYMSANKRAKALEEFWVKEPEHRETASYGKNWGYYSGMDEIKKYYVDNNPFGAAGTNLCHPIATIRVVEADDGQTIQAMWYNVSYETRIVDGKLSPLWIAEKAAADLVKEGDDWKIWHLFVGVDMQCPPGSHYDDLPVDLAPEDDPVAVEFGTPTLPMDAYITRYNYYPYPIIPEPYATFADTVSCGPDGQSKIERP